MTLFEKDEMAQILTHIGHRTYSWRFKTHSAKLTRKGSVLTKVKQWQRETGDLILLQNNKRKCVCFSLTKDKQKKNQYVGRGGGISFKAPTYENQFKRAGLIRYKSKIHLTKSQNGHGRVHIHPHNTRTLKYITESSHSY